MKAPSLAAAFLLAAPALAQTAPGQEKVSQVIIYGDDGCPIGSEDLIVVCHKLPESERYRIPETLRGNPNDPANQSWASRAIELQYVGRSGIGSCSPVGAGGASGCFQDIVRAARAERAGRESVSWEQLIAEARAERLARMQAEAEAESKGPQ